VVSARLTSEERREHLLHVGVDLLGRFGTADISIEEIAREAGVSKGLLYHYFPTKNDFFLAVLGRSQAEMDQELVREPDLSPLERFDRNLEGFLQFVDTHAEGYLAVVNARGREPRVQQLVGERRRRRIDELVALAAVLEGAPRDAVRTPLLEAAIEGWLGFSEGVTVRWLRDREIGRADVHELLRRALLEAFDTVLARQAGVRAGSQPPLS
jgi:AcrR family transcriptional regulator